ncbi:acyl carrier protein [Paenibacillus sp. S150]|uniref:acyl carrier protein n=1 Tax=Paenibacillus sp. S150 TaxID=2749826 RepID=UPI001C5667BF|nr:acyl carrier protein [Paenibacillus sp. S150]MBW4084441.1 acyl carrier protein [Paenibacillus sp. S150]
MKQVKDIVSNFISNNFIVNMEQLGDDDSLVEKGIVDSTGIIILVCFVEDTFQFQISDSEITMDNFGSVNAIVHYIQNQIERTSV